MAWTEERIGRLEQLLVDDRRLTASEIACELGDGTSRNMVIGKAKRLNLKLPQSGGADSRIYNRHGRERIHKAPLKPRVKKRALKAKPVLVSAPYVEPRATVVMPDHVDPHHVTLLELKQDHCRWPYGDSPFIFCGHDRLIGSSYCPYHDKESKPRAGNWAEPTEKFLRLGIRNTRKTFNYKPGTVDEAAA